MILRHRLQLLVCVFFANGAIIVIYYISDLHIGHKNALAFDNRPFSTVDEMEKAIIINRNSRVTRSDDVYVLGDVFYRFKGDRTEFLSKLGGRLHLIVGNHDGKLLADASAMARFASVSGILDITDEGRAVALCHYPIADWNMKYRGGYHVYGHVHSAVNGGTIFMQSLPRAYNAGCMINNYAPATLNELALNNRIFREKNNIQGGSAQ